jgi:hypothetical protein
LIDWAVVWTRPVMLDAEDDAAVAVTELFSVLLIGPAVWTREPIPPVVALFALAVRLWEAPSEPPIVAEEKGDVPPALAVNVFEVEIEASPDVWVTSFAPLPPSETAFRATS